MELRLREGDYVRDELGGVERLTGGEAVLQRALFRLSARRGAFPFLPELGSRLYLLPRQPAAQRAGLAREYVAEALRGEAVSVTETALEEEGGVLRVRVLLDWQGEARSGAVEV